MPLELAFAFSLDPDFIGPAVFGFRNHVQEALVLVAKFSFINSEVLLFIGKLIAKGQHQTLVDEL